jgi:hypothetical protein
MAGQTEQAAGTDISPMGSWFVRHPIATFLVLVYATTTALVFVPKELTEPGLLPGGATSHRGTGECSWVGCASIYCYRAGEWKGWRAGHRPAQLLVVGVAALVSDQPGRSTVDLSDRRHDPVWFRAAARSGPELVAAVHRIPAGIGDHDLAGQCRRGDRMDRVRLRLIPRSSWSAPRRRADDDGR